MNIQFYKGVLLITAALLLGVWVLVNRKKSPKLFWLRILGVFLGLMLGLMHIYKFSFNFSRRISIVEIFERYPKEVGLFCLCYGIFFLSWIVIDRKNTTSVTFLRVFLASVAGILLGLYKIFIET